MFRYFFAYRHNDGAIRAYIGKGRDYYTARDDGLVCLRTCCEAFNETPDMWVPHGRFIWTDRACTPEEFKAIKKQWRSLKRAFNL